ARYGIPIVNKRIALTPVAFLCDALDSEDPTPIAHAIDRAAAELGIDFIGGYTALVQKGATVGDRRLINSLPEALATTNRLCASINVASTKAGINMEVVQRLGHTIKEMAARTADKGGLACGKFAVFCNAPEDNPFMAGAQHGPGEPEATLNVGISGPGVVRHVVEQLPDCDFTVLAESIKRTAFKITRAGELIGRAVANELSVPFGVVDISLAPTPLAGDSVGEILQAMGLQTVGTHGSTAALALLNDCVKKGGAMASSAVGGMSGAFIPVSEDATMIAAAAAGVLTLDKLEAMTSVCCVGLDMVAVPGDTPAATLSAIIADEMAIGMINNKTTAVRIIPVPGKGVGEFVEFGGLLGKAPIMPVHPESCERFIRRSGHIPAPIQSLTN
ncbi:MAG TPA: PFL family protein, partial [bacterium]|nr:PFL family protein [bacterium]